MKRNFIIAFSAAAVSVVCLSAFGFSASAATVDEVADAARAYGLSEEDIQAGYNEYYSNPAAYPPEKLDEVIAKLHEAKGTIITTGAYVPENNPVTEQTTSPAQEQQQSDDNNQQTQSKSDDSITLTAPDGSQFTRISAERFIAMSYEEKMAYISSFPQDRQQVIIDNLSPAEYKSLIKQAPSERKMEIIHSLSGAANEMGLAVAVDEISDDSVTISMRNSDGKLVNVSTAGASVEDTGYDRRGIYAAAAAALLTALAGIVFIANRCFGKEKTE